MFLCLFFFFFFFNDTATTEIYTLSLHDALPIFANRWHCFRSEVETQFRRLHISPEPKTLIDLCQFLKAHPCVVTMCPVSTTLGRQLHTDTTAPKNYRTTRITSNGSMGSALIVCNSINRPGYLNELLNIRDTLHKQMKLTVSMLGTFSACPS